MSTEKQILEIVDKLKIFENKIEVLPFIHDNIFNSDSEDFYQDANTELQVFIYDLIFLLEQLLDHLDLDIVNSRIKKFNLSNYKLIKVEDQDFHYKVTTNICDLVF